MKLNTLLAKTDHLSSIFQAMVAEFKNFFGNNSTAFRGEKKTYEPAPNTADDPSRRANKFVISTVEEKLAWLEENSKEYIDSLFSQEATNASGTAKAELKVLGVSWGVFSSLELLRLKSVVESSNLEQMYSAIPTRKDDEEWAPHTQEQYKGRKIFESPKLEGEAKSIVKETYILTDPNVAYLKDTSKYAPVVASKDTPLKLGDYTYQKFSGELSAREKAELLKRRSVLISAIIEALKVANETEAVKSELTADKIFTFLHKGQNA